MALISKITNAAENLGVIEENTMEKFNVKQKNFTERASAESLTLFCCPTTARFSGGTLALEFHTWENEFENCSACDKFPHESPRLKIPDFQTNAVFTEIEAKLRLMLPLSDSFDLVRFDYSILDMSAKPDEINFAAEFFDTTSDTRLNKKFDTKKMDAAQKTQLDEIIKILTDFAWAQDDDYLNLY